MNIGILTHPQHINYGGILQCFALSTYLKQLGHNPIVLRREMNQSFGLKRIVKNLLCALGVKRYLPISATRGRNIQAFVNQTLNRTTAIEFESKMKKVCNDYHLDAVLVGSDQVWRRDFAILYGYNYFLDFVPSHIIKASYAASFGLDTWDYTPSESEKIRSLVNEFRGVSVREEAAVSLCKENMKVDAQLLIDPTLLLNEDSYSSYVSSRLIAEKYIFVYWLGDLNDIAQEISIYKSKGYRVKLITLRGSHILDSVEDWLSYIKYADLVLTDSFHGCVFSMIFQKQFVAYCNKSGGYGRIESLFVKMGIPEKMTNPRLVVDYHIIDEKKQILQKQAQEYLLAVLQS